MASKGSAISRCVTFIREGNGDEVRVAFQLMTEEFGKRFVKGPGGRLTERKQVVKTVKTAAAPAAADPAPKKRAARRPKQKVNAQEHVTAGAPAPESTGPTGAVTA